MAKYKAYPEYKSSKVNYLGDIPKEWKLIKFGITNSSAELGGNYLASEGEQGIAVIKMGNLGRGVVNLARIERIPLNEKYDTHHLLKAGDFLFNTRNSLELVGKVSVWREELEHAIYNSNILRITFDKKFVDSTDFISYLFNSDRALSQLRLIAKGTTSVAAIYYKDLSSLVFAFPPVREQAKIADFLDFETAQIDTLIEKQQTLIQLLKEKRQAVISHAVTKGLNPDALMKDSGVEWLGEVPEHWEVGRLKNVLRIRNGRDYKEVEVESGGYPVYGSGGIFKRSSDYLFDGESVLFGRKGTVDKPLLVSGKFWTVDTMFYSEASSNAKPNYIYHQALLFPFDQLSTNTALPSMTQENLLELGFVIPPFDEQEQICQYLSDKLKVFSNLVSKAEKAIQLMQERRTALISAAVTGKIDVRGWRASE